MMTVHVLHAGDGYTYLTRQVASGDVQRERGQELADYYTAQGAPPGRWAGRGAAALGMEGQVTEAHMKALFGEGLHPDADRLTVENIRAGMNAEAAIEATRLGRKFPRFANENPFGEAVMAACKEHSDQTGKWPVFTEKKAIEQRIARERMESAGIVGTVSDDEVRAYIKSQRNTTRQPVAGYDLVFTPAKSVSVLWGLGDDSVRRAVSEAHAAAVARSMDWIEAECGYTRRGKAGVEQITSEGLTVAAFDHFDNRAGDPNLHTHCAVSNRVLSEDGKWRALDARVLHRAAVAASETYNLAIEDELTRRLEGVRFTDSERGAGKRVVREIEGIDRRLCDEFSRRPSIERRLAELSREYRANHGCDPDKATQHKLAQQATLETREGKAKPRSLASMREEWEATANRVLGAGGVAAMLADACAGSAPGRVSAEALDRQAVAERAIARVGRDRSTWTRFHVTAEVSRQLAGHRFGSADERAEAVEQITTLALAGHSVTVSAPPTEVPNSMRRRDGESVLTQHCSTQYSSAAVLAAERRVLDAASEPTALVLDRAVVTAAAHAHEASEGFALNAGQLALAHHFAGSGALVAAGVGPAGTGKTTAMQVVARAWEGTGGGVVALGPSARAADVLGDELGTAGRTLADVLVRHKHGLDCGINPGDLVLLDEAGMAATMDVDELVSIARERGAVVRLLGDPQQLAAVESGGLLRDVAEQTDAPELREIHRFSDSSEAEATLRLREGDRSVTDWYTGRGRVSTGLSVGLVEDVLSEHLRDLDDGASSLMIAADNETVRALNERAHMEHLRRAPDADGGAVALSDGLAAVIGDRIVTRRNDRRLRPIGADDPAAGNRVRNGDLWTVEGIEGGALTVRSTEHGGVVTLPPEYVSRHTELGYASTVHRAQGMTVDRCRVLVSAGMNRQALYVAASRGRHVNQLYVADDELPDIEAERPDPETPPAVVTLRAIIARDASDATAHRTRAESTDEARSLPTLVSEYAAVHDRISDALAHRLLDDRVSETLASSAHWKRARAILAIAAETDDRLPTLVDAALSDLDGQWDEERFCDRLVVHARARRSPGSSSGLRRSLGLSGTPLAQPGVDPDLHATLVAMGERVDRAAAVAADAAAGAPWQDELPAAPAGAEDVRAGLVAEIAVWRAYHQVPDTENTPVPEDAGDERGRQRLRDRLLSYRAQAVTKLDPVRSLDDGELARRRAGARARLATMRTDHALARARAQELAAGPAQARVRRELDRLHDLARRINERERLAAERPRVAGRRPAEAAHLDRQLTELDRTLPPRAQWAGIIAQASNTAEQRARMDTATDTDRHDLSQARTHVDRLAADVERQHRTLTNLDNEATRRGGVPTTAAPTTDAGLPPTPPTAGSDRGPELD